MESKLIGQFFFITNLVGTFPQFYLEPFYPQNLRTYRNVLSYSRWNSLGKPHRNPAPSRTFLQTTQKAELCVIGKLLRTSRTFPPKKKLTTLQLTTWFRWSNCTLTVLKPNSKLPKNHTSGRPSNHKIAAFRNSWSWNPPFRLSKSQRATLQKRGTTPTPQANLPILLSEPSATQPQPRTYGVAPYMTFPFIGWCKFSDFNHSAW